MRTHSCRDLYGSLRQLCNAQIPALNVDLSAKDKGQMGQKRAQPAEWSHRRTRCDPPALAEAITAARGLTGHIEGQIEIAAQLMGLPEDEVRPEVLKAAAFGDDAESKAAHPRSRRPQVVVVERRTSRIPRR